MTSDTKLHLILDLTYPQFELLSDCIQNSICKDLEMKVHICASKDIKEEEKHFFYESYDRHVAQKEG